MGWEICHVRCEKVRLYWILYFNEVITTAINFGFARYSFHAPAFECNFDTKFRAWIEILVRWCKVKSARSFLQTKHVNPFLVNVPILYFLKNTSKSLVFLGGIKMWTLARNELNITRGDWNNGFFFVYILSQTPALTCYFVLVS